MVQPSNRRIYNVGILSLFFALVIVGIFSWLGQSSLVTQPIPTITGVSQFTIFYLMAQFVERVVEPFSGSQSLFGESKKNQIGKENLSGEEKKKLSSPEKQMLGEKERENENAQQARTLALWCFASALGIVLCYFTVGLFQMAKIVFNGSAGHFIDAVLSGVIIGSGTKPLHDLIGFITSKNP